MNASTSNMLLSHVHTHPPPIVRLALRTWVHLLTLPWRLGGPGPTRAQAHTLGGTARPRHRSAQMQAESPVTITAQAYLPDCASQSCLVPACGVQPHPLTTVCKPELLAVQSKTATQ
eukprot:105604-Chlamydomonas_euryale.AAC.6